MTDDRIAVLLEEYLAYVRAMDDPGIEEIEYRKLSSARTIVHDELIRMLGPDFGRPFNMVSYARNRLGEKHGHD